MKKTVISVGLFALLLGVSFTSSASLSVRDNGNIVYDNDIDLVWLADANYSLTSQYNSSGLMNFNAANRWAGDLAVNGNSDWRLPTIDEMRHLFYDELDGNRGSDIAVIHNNANYGMFQHLNSSVGFGGAQGYWSDAEAATNPSKASVFTFHSGQEFLADKTTGYYAMAVSNVPEPEVYAMLMAGLGLLGVMARRKK